MRDFGLFLAMPEKPWYEKKNLDPAFPFTLYEIPMKVFNLHWHDTIEIIYVISGTMLVTVEGQSYKITARDILVINSGAIHSLDNVIGTDTSINIFNFGLELFGQTLVDFRDRASQKLVFDRKVFFKAGKDRGLHGKAEALLLGIRDEYLTHRPGYRFAMKAKWYELALLFLRQIPEKGLSERERVRHHHNRVRLERIFTFIHDNYTDMNIVLEKAAEAAALSKFHFTRFFKIETGQTFHTYLAKVRISRAIECLIQSDSPITDIAYTSGFSSVKTFNRLFKRYTGVSPSAYRYGKKQQFLRQTKQ
jgi:AraC-like DNA-binding protein